MGWLDEKAEFVDFTLLKKRGLLKVPEEQKMPENCKVKGEFVDFTRALAEMPANPASNNEAANISASPSASSAMPDFGFLANMAGVGAENSSNSADASEAAPNSEVVGARGSDIESLKVKIDDLEYKLERLIERLEKVEGKAS